MSPTKVTHTSPTPMHSVLAQVGPTHLHDAVQVRHSPKGLKKTNNGGSRICPLSASPFGPSTAGQPIQPDHSRPSPYMTNPLSLAHAS